MLACAGVAALAAVNSDARAAPAPFDLLLPAVDAYVPDAQPVMSWSAASSGVALDAYVVRVDDVAIGFVDPADCDTTCEAELPDPLAEGRHTWQIVAVDVDDGQTASAVRAFTVDTVPPVINERSYPATGSGAAFVPGKTYPLRPTNCAASTKPVTISVAQSFRMLMEPTLPPGPIVVIDASQTTERYSVDGVPVASLCGVPAGAHTLSVVSTDAAGNTGTWTGPITSDPVQPVITYGGELRGVRGTTVKLGTRPGTAVAPARYFRQMGSTWVSLGSDPSLRFPGTVGQSAVTLGVRDAEWDVATTTVAVVAGPKPPIGEPGIEFRRTLNRYVNERDVPLRVVWPGGALSYTMSDSAGSRAVSAQAKRSLVTWRLGGNGRSSRPTTILVRFDWPDPGKSYGVRTTLDLEKPRVLRASVTGRRLSLTAGDRVSGVAGVQVAKRKSKPTASVAYSRRSGIKISTARWVRVRDRAGNFSAWERIRR